MSKTGTSCSRFQTENAVAEADEETEPDEETEDEADDLTVGLAQVHTRSLAGVDALPVLVEVQLCPGLPAFNIVGLPETAVRESRDRVRAAIGNAGLEFPERKIIVNLAPADLPKQGSRFDLAIAIGLLVASDQLNQSAVSRYEFVAELSLGGALREVGGALPAAMCVAGDHRALVMAPLDAAEAALYENCEVFSANSLTEVVRRLHSGRGFEPVVANTTSARKTETADLSDVKGQQQARRALEIAAAGGHNLLLVGPPGTGKSMLASRLPGILPPMSVEEATQSASVASVSNLGFQLQDWRRRPFRAPHHTASGVALVGGGGTPRPGEISLAHNGVLFLDELPEFPRAVLDVLRQPLEDGCVTISRAGRSADFPANFQLVAAMNPCPCGHDGDPGIVCRCTPDQVARYRSRLSGPFLDRIDMHVGVPRINPVELGKWEAGESSRVVRERVATAFQRQLTRQGFSNTQLASNRLEEVCQLGGAERGLLDEAALKLKFSLRAHHRLLRVARTIADLASVDSVERNHLLEAISYRQLF